MTERKRASAFEMPTLAENKTSNEQTDDAIRELARKERFTVRHATEEPESEKRSHIRRRRLAKTPRKSTVQLNVLVEEDTRDRFWDMAEKANVQNGEGFLIALMNAYEKSKK